MSPQTSSPSATPGDQASEIGRLQLIIRSALAGVRTAIPVRVVACTNSGGVSPVGTVTLQPLVQLLDQNGNLWDHAQVYNAPYMRIQGGTNAIIIDPVAGDVGIAVICDRDISAVKTTGNAAGPGSARKHDIADMVYLGTIISAAPTQYIVMSEDGVKLISPIAVEITAPAVTINGIDFSTHVHTSASPGSPTSPPL